MGTHVRGSNCFSLRYYRCHWCNSFYWCSTPTPGVLWPSYLFSCSPLLPAALAVTVGIYVAQSAVSQYSLLCSHSLLSVSVGPVSVLVVHSKHQCTTGGSWHRSGTLTCHFTFWHTTQSPHSGKNTCIIKAWASAHRMVTQSHTPISIQQWGSHARNCFLSYGLMALPCC